MTGLGVGEINNIYQMGGAPSGMRNETDIKTLVARLSRVEDMVPLIQRGGSFAGQGRNQYLPIASGGVQVGKLDLTSTSALSFQGIVAPNVVDGQFTVAKPSDSSATLYWDGTNSSRVIVIRRADGTTTTVTPSNITITGLTHDVQYQVLPYWSPNSACGLGFAPGTVGTPAIAFASTDSDTTVNQARSIQSLAGNEPLGNVSWTQPASGGSSGAGNPVTPPSRNPGTCVMVNTNIEPVHEISPWDWKTVNHPETNWRRIVTENLMSLQCTKDHPLYDDNQEQREADWFTSGKWISTRFGLQKVADASDFYRDCTKMQVMMKTGHLFWANGFLSHNIKLPQE